MQGSEIAFGVLKIRTVGAILFMQRGSKRSLAGLGMYSPIDRFSRWFLDCFFKTNFLFFQAMPKNKPKPQLFT